MELRQNIIILLLSRKAFFFQMRDNMPGREQAIDLSRKTRFFNRFQQTGLRRTRTYRFWQYSPYAEIYSLQKVKLTIARSRYHIIRPGAKLPAKPGAPPTSRQRSPPAPT